MRESRLIALLYATIMFFAVALFVVCTVECGSLTAYHFEAPGLGGMVSNYDVGMLQPTDAFYLFNGYVTETPGMIERRTAISDYGVNTTVLYGAFGYYNPLTGDKLVIGVTDNAVDGLGQFVVSDTFGTEVGYDTLGGTIFPAGDVYHDWTPYKDMVICADGKSLACIFSTSEYFMHMRANPDTFAYDPHVISMGLEAPGQPRVGLMDGTGSVTGSYIYAFMYQSDSILGIESRPIKADNQNIYVTNLPLDSAIYVLRRRALPQDYWYLMCDTTITGEGIFIIDSGQTSVLDTTYLYRVRWYKDGGGAQYDTLPTTDLVGYTTPRPGALGVRCCPDPFVGVYDSMGYRRQFGPPQADWCHYCGRFMIFLIGSINITTDIDSFFLDTIGTPSILTGVGHAPGQLRVGVLDSAVVDTSAQPDTTIYYRSNWPCGVIDTTQGVHPESLYYVAYSYYDPVTGMESPLGRSLPCSLSGGSWADDSLEVYTFRLDNFDTTLNPKWIRVYQTLTKTTLPGAGDSTVWYGILEVRVSNGGVCLGDWSDDDVVTGLDTSVLTLNHYYEHELLRNDIGDVKVLPPYHYDCRIPFSDIEYMAGQLWGIGDPDYSNRIYFSEYDTYFMNIFSWYPLDFIQINEIGNDELVKIERAEGFGADALYVFAHNSIWLLNTNGDYQAVSTRVGAASQETVVKHGTNVYFLSPNLRFYALTGGQLQEISQPVENYVESVFVDWNAYGYQGFYAWAHTFGDYVRWFNDTTGMGLSFNTKSGAWTLERYGSGAYVPRGSFSYDTMRSGGASVVMTSDVELLYMDSTVSLRKADPTATFDVAGTGRTNSLERAIQFVYWTPSMTDGSRYRQVQEIDLTLKVRAAGALHYTVYNQYGDSLCGDSVSLPWSDTVVHLRIHAPYNRSLRPSVRIYSNDTDTLTTNGGDPRFVQYYHNFGIMDMTVWFQDMGVGRVQ